MTSYGCGNKCGVDMEYIGNGDWKCPKCGAVITFGESDDEDEDEFGEALSVWDAAEIYLSHGFDPDYNFGYTHEELIKVLRQR